MIIESIIQKTGGFQSTKVTENSKGQIPFKDLLAEAVTRVNQTDASSIQGNIDLVTNGEADLHTIMINAEKADIALQYTLQIRNKLLDAYNEIMRMQV